MNKIGGLSKKASLGIVFIFAGLIVAAKENVIIGIGMMGIGVFLVATD